MFAAASICSGVSRTTVLIVVEPDRLMLDCLAAGRSSLVRDPSDTLGAVARLDQVIGHDASFAERTSAR
jgi:hypothetical protein